MPGVEDMLRMLAGVFSDDGLGMMTISEEIVMQIQAEMPGGQLTNLSYREVRVVTDFDEERTIDTQTHPIYSTAEFP